MTREPLAKGDDGSGNRYPVRAVVKSCKGDFAGYGGCISPKGHEGLCRDANGYRFATAPKGDDCVDGR